MFVVAVFALAGCGQSTFELKVDESGRAVLTAEVVPDREHYIVDDPGIRETIEELKRLGPTITSHEFEAHLGTGYRVTMATDDYEDLVQGLLNPTPPAGTPEIKIFERISIEQIEGGLWQFLATMRPTMEILTAMGHGDIEELWPAGSLGHIAVSLPGEIFSTNGEVISSGTARWDMSDLRNGETMELTTTGTWGGEPLGPGAPESGAPVEPGSGESGSGESGSAETELAEPAESRSWVGLAAVIALVVAVVALLALARLAITDGRLVSAAVPGRRPPGPAGPESRVGRTPHRAPGPPAAPQVPSSPALASPPPSAPPPPPLVPPPAPPAPPAPPTAPPAASPAPPGWYPDPAGEATHRWWSGTAWTEHTD